MSIEIIRHVFNFSRARGGDLVVLLSLADYANDDGVAFPSISKLAEKSRMSERNVCYALGKLELLGELTRERSSGGNNRRSRYRVNLNPETHFSEICTANSEAGFT